MAKAPVKPMRLFASVDQQAAIIRLNSRSKVDGMLRRLESVAAQGWARESVEMPKSILSAKQKSSSLAEPN